MQKDALKLTLVLPTNQLLNRVADEVAADEITSPYIQGVIDRMLQLAAGKGHGKDTRQMVGLAAPQLGVGKRIISIDVTADGSLKEQNLQVFINPRITHRSKNTVPGREGCWSCGNICGNVARAEEVTLEGLDRDGKPLRITLNGFTARIAQHETDHLDGVRFPDCIPENEPDKLHWVEPSEFPEYRLHWATWPTKCRREKWTAMKKGVKEL